MFLNARNIRTLVWINIFISSTTIKIKKKKKNYNLLKTIGQGHDLTFVLITWHNRWWLYILCTQCNIANQYYLPSSDAAAAIASKADALVNVTEVHTALIMLTSRWVGIFWTSKFMC